MKLVHIAVLALGVCALAAGAAQAADLLVSDAPLAQQMDSSVYAKLFGGVTAPDNIFFSSQNYDIDAGGFLGAAIGTKIGDTGLSLELELTGSKATYETGNDLLAVTLMGNAVFSAPISDSVALYGGVGVGAAQINFDHPTNDSFDSDGQAAVGQLFLGVEAKVVDNVSLFAEARYQAALADVTMTRSNGISYDIEYQRTAVLGGVKFGF